MFEKLKNLKGCMKIFTNQNRSVGIFVLDNLNNIFVKETCNTLRAFTKNFHVAFFCFSFHKHFQLMIAFFGHKNALGS
jgi:hypothetical protein